MVDPTKLVLKYETGMIVRNELLKCLCQAAAEQPPEQIAANIPLDVLVEIREWSATPPDSPDKYLVVQMGCFADEFDRDRHARDESRRLYDGLWRWYRYFLEI